MKALELRCRSNLCDRIRARVSGNDLRIEFPIDDAHFNFIDVHPKDGRKLRNLLNAWLSDQGEICAFPNRRKR